VNKTEFIEELEIILDLEEGALEAQPEYGGSEAWDSISMLGIIALLDGELGVSVNVAELRACKEIEDLFAIIGDKLEL